MKTLALLSLSLAVALGLPAFVQDEAQSRPDLTKEEQRPLLGDLLPAQGHVVLEDPAPQVRLSQDQQEKVAQVKVEPEVKPEPEVVKVEPKVEPELEVKEEPEVEPEPEVVKVEPKVEPEPQVKVEPEPEVQVEPKVEPEPEVQVEPKVEPEPEVKEEPEVEPEEPQLEDVPNFMALSEDEEPEMNPEDEEVQEVEDEFKVQMDLEPETEPIMELEPLDDEGNMLGNDVELPEKQRNFEEPIMELEPETETDQQLVERHVDMERGHEVMVEPIMELEPLDDDDSKLELPEMQGNFEEPIMELEPETRQEEVVPQAMMDEGPALDINGEPMPRLEEYFPNEEARMGMKSIMDEAESEYLSEEQPLLYEEAALMRQEQDDQAIRLRSCPGVSHEGKCYEFFRGPKKAVDAEFFCQQHFHDGHLASITSRNIHAKIMNMMKQQHGRFTRTWVGGLRYLDSGRFVWLDGSRWTYADWLSGEPNNTSNLEDCIEVLPSGKFNDFTCWEPQAFVCSYPQ